MIPPIRHSPFATCHSRQRPRGFTLTEILVVIVIVVLMLGMALPVFRFITGSRSEEGSANHISAMLGRARAEAIGLQKPIGIAFLPNSSTQTTNMALVELADCPDWSANQTYNLYDYVKQVSGGGVYYFISTQAANKGHNPPGNQSDLPPYWRWVGGPPIEIRPDTDVESLPAGIGVQTICNATYNAANVRQTDGYLATGVILFDGSGRLTSQLYGISQFSQLAKAAGLIQSYPSAKLVGRPGTNLFGVDSQFGLVVFQREAFASQNFSPDDPEYTQPTSQWQSSYTSGTPSEAQEELWLDQNATPLQINRFNGTLVKGE